ncbi:erythromycin esterase-domain-containing protein [Apiosordaria backusii]|uniref:Erythromycin esterase-domain-containing protein n=1 Tax=Apiosordaria backusii TaxID=314023 RepID=A0AA40EI60_9PEZI|nr:erythromycin esterase-domain-containing protein [Apiosordaria backusii]
MKQLTRPILLKPLSVSARFQSRSHCLSAYTTSPSSKMFTKSEPRPLPPDDPTVALLRKHLTPIPPISESSTKLTDFFSSFASSDNLQNETKIILIGDSTHGTSDFYHARAELTKHFIQHHGFNIVAVEADWPDAEAVDRHVRPRSPSAPRSQETEKPFQRFPTWMWRNLEFQNFTKWLKEWNAGKDSKTEAVGFYGLDLYSLGKSMQAVVDYLERVDPQMAKVAQKRYERMMMWAEEPHEYGLEALAAGFKGCEEDVMKILRDLLKKRVEYESKVWDGEEFHSGEQNARLVKDAEQYYKAMYYGRDESWNLRDRHMFETLVRILKHRSRRTPSKAIVWAHNSHIGDARATSMGWSNDELNIGQLCKEAYGNQALSIGCLTNTGTVAAARKWDGDMQVMKVRPGLPNSYEQLMHATGIKNFVLDLRAGHCDEKLREALMAKRLERFIGVIYAPMTERQSHYSHAVLPEQFDGFIWFDETRHVGALEVHQPHGNVEFDETWPFGL